MRPAISQVPDRESNPGGQLTLNVNRILLYSWSFGEGREERDVLANSREGPLRQARRLNETIGERVAERVRRRRKAIQCGNIRRRGREARRRIGGT